MFKMVNEYCNIINTPKPRYSKPLFSKYLNLVNKLQLPSYIFYNIHHLDLVNKRGQTGSFTKSRVGCNVKNINASDHMKNMQDISKEFSF